MQTIILTNTFNVMRIKKIRRVILFFIVALILSGITAFPIKSGMALLVDTIDSLSFDNNLFQWIREARIGVIKAYNVAPFIAYGTDWLGFAHIVIAIAFVGPYAEPIKNKWVIQFGMIACLLVLPMALIAGSIRNIPLLWRLIDCSFGVFGFITLYYCLRLINNLQASKNKNY